MNLAGITKYILLRIIYLTRVDLVRVLIGTIKF